MDNKILERKFNKYIKEIINYEFKHGNLKNFGRYNDGRDTITDDFMDFCIDSGLVDVDNYDLDEAEDNEKIEEELDKIGIIISRVLCDFIIQNIQQITPIIIKKLGK